MQPARMLKVTPGVLRPTYHHEAGAEMVAGPILNFYAFRRSWVADDANVNRRQCSREVSEVGYATLDSASHAVKPHRPVGYLPHIQGMSVGPQRSRAGALAVEDTVKVQPQFVLFANQPHMGPRVDGHGFLGGETLTQVTHAGNAEAHLNYCMGNDEIWRRVDIEANNALKSKIHPICKNSEENRLYWVGVGRGSAS